MTLNPVCFRQIFSPSRSYLHVCVWQLSITQTWKSCTVQTDLQTAEDLHMSLHYHSTELALTTQKSLSWEKEQEVWTRGLLIKSVPISIDNNVVLAATNWMACWKTLGKIRLIGLYRYMQKSHFACLCQLRVISLTHAIKDYLYWRITILNPGQLLHFENRALRSWPIMLNK